jgi:hypothetical protein
MRNSAGNEGNPLESLPPLKITCTSSKCEDGLHCFLQKKRQKTKVVQKNPHGTGGKCRACGADLVAWDRVYRNDLSDVGYTFEMLKYELIRHHFWHRELDQKAVNHARRKGRSGMRIAAEQRLRKSVGDANPAYDGRQTPKSGNALFYAQHATATCCRKCVEEWHGIPRGVPLSQEAIAYFTELLMLFVGERLPQLEEDGMKVERTGPKKRSRRKPTESPAAAEDRILWHE